MNEIATSDHSGFIDHQLILTTLSFGKRPVFKKKEKELEI